MDGRPQNRIHTGRVVFAARNISVRASRDKILVNGVSFALERGTLLAIAGRAGSGKSTLLNALTGVRKPSTGTVEYAGRDVYGNSDDLREHIRYVPQKMILHEQLTVRQTLDFAAELRLPAHLSAAQRSDRVDTVLRDLGLLDCVNNRLAKTSGGEQKRVSIAVELLTEPSLLFLDEPLANLDPDLQEEVMGILEHLAHDTGRVIVAVVHQEYMLDRFDRVLFMAHGEMAYFGPPREALKHFGVADYIEVYQALRERKDWGQAFRRSSLYDRSVGTIIEQSQGVPGGARMDPLPGSRQRGHLPQWWTLTKRYVAVIRSDVRIWLPFALIGAGIGLALLFILPQNAFDPQQQNAKPQAAQVVLFLSLSAIVVGMTGGVLAIVDELEIYLRERLVGLSVTAYVSSKATVLMLIIAMQTAILMLVAVAHQDGPQVSAFFSPPLLELWIDLTLIGFAAMAMSLLMSSLVTRRETAISLVLPFVIAQMLLTGFPIAVQDKPTLEKVSDVSVSQWGFSAVASTVDLITLSTPHLSGGANGVTQASQPSSTAALAPEDHPHWAHTPDSWRISAIALLIFAVAGIVGAGVRLRLREISVRATHLDALQVMFRPQLRTRRARWVRSVVVAGTIISLTALGLYQWGFWAPRPYIASVAFSPDGSFVAYGSGDGTIKRWRTTGSGASFPPLHRYDGGAAAPISSIAMSPDGKLIAATDSGTEVIVWALATQTEQLVFRGHAKTVYGVAFSPNGAMLATASGDRTVALWDIPGRKLRATFSGSADMLSVSFSPDGSTLAVGSVDGSVSLWEPATGHVRLLGRHRGAVYSTAFSPGGAVVASGAQDGLVKLWDIAGPMVRILDGRSASVYSVAFSPNGKTVAAGMEGNRITAWDVAGAGELYSLPTSSSVYSVAFSPDNSSLAVGSRDGTVTLWH